VSADLLRPPPASPAGPTRPAGGRGYLVVGGSRANLRVHRRSAIVGVLLLVALVVTAAVSMITGDFPITLDRVLATLAGNGDSGEDFIVWTLRMPRLLLAVLIGAALAVAGGLFQSLTRNPLGSPDVIGFQAGSATGALLVILVWHGSSGQVSLGAIVGGLVTAALIYLLAMKGGLHGFRLILVGIGMAAMLTAANDYLITRAKLIEAQDAAVWLTGSLNAAAWDQVLPLVLVVVALFPFALWAARDLRMLELGDDLAGTLGVAGPRTRTVTMVVAVGLAAAATAAAGPVVFVALAAPQIARRLVGVPGPSVLPAALTGAVLVAASDIVAQRIVSEPLPVGVVTGVVGGIYLAWLLGRAWQRGTA